MLGNRVLEQDRIDDFSPRLKPGVSWVRTKQETPNALPTPLAPPFLPIAKARGISEDLDDGRKDQGRHEKFDNSVEKLYTPPYHGRLQRAGILAIMLLRRGLWHARGGWSCSAVSQ